MLSSARFILHTCKPLIGSSLTPVVHAEVVVKTLHSTSYVTVQMRQFASEAKTLGRRANKYRKSAWSVKSIVNAEAGASPFTIGRGALAGASAFGLGALCYYGLGLSSEPGALERSALWPEYIRARVRDTYVYFGGGVALTAASALGVSRSPAFMRLMMKNSWLAIGATLAAVIGSGMVCRAIPYQEGVGLKQLAWAGHAAVLGAVVAPLALLGGPLLVRAAWYTAGVVGGLSAVAVCAPSDKFLTMGGPLALCLGGVLVASIGGMFFPPTTALGAGLYSISVYGGLVVFSGFLLYDTQKIVKYAESLPPYSAHMYDPINASMGIYMDTINIFIRIAMILASGGNSRRR